MDLHELVPIVLKASVFLSVFAIGLKASAQDATYLFRRPRELIIALIAINLLMPLFAIALVMIFDFRPVIKIVLMTLAVSPIPPLLPNKMTKAGGTDSYAIGMLVALALLSIIFVPLAMETLESVFSVSLRMDFMAITGLIFKTVILPIGLGLLAHQLSPKLSERMVKPMSQIAGITMMTCFVAILILMAHEIVELVGDGTIFALAAFVLMGLAIGHILGGPVPENRTSLAISTSSRHPGIAIALASINFPEQTRAMTAVLLYLLVNALISVPYCNWIKRRQEVNGTNAVHQT